MQSITSNLLRWTQSLPSPRQNTTAPTPPYAQGTPSQSRHSQSCKREHVEDARLLTPPPTWPFSYQECHPSPYPNKTRLTPRRPTHAPMPVHAGPATPSGGECDNMCSTSSSSSLHSLPPYAYSPSIGQGQSMGGSLQLYARKASARCHAIEGYASFARVEGLGEPAETI